MSGQRRAFAVAALLCALALSGCASPASAGRVCELPDDAKLVVDIDGGYIVQYDNGTTSALRFANGACVFDRLQTPIVRAERTDAELVFIYDYSMLRLIPCLEAHGFTVFAPPTRDSFLASGGNWSPWDSVFTPLMDGDEIAQLYRDCPQLPPKLFSWD